MLLLITVTGYLFRGLSRSTWMRKARYKSQVIGWCRFVWFLNSQGRPSPDVIRRRHAAIRSSVSPAFGPNIENVILCHCINESSIEECLRMSCNISFGVVVIMSTSFLMKMYGKTISRKTIGTNHGRHWHVERFRASTRLQSFKGSET